MKSLNFSGAFAGRRKCPAVSKGRGLSLAAEPSFPVEKLSAVEIGLFENIVGLLGRVSQDLLHLGFVIQ